MKTYKITLKHDNGRTTIENTADDEKTAISNVLKAEGAPQNAVVKVKEVLFKVLKIGRKYGMSGRRKVIARYLSLSEAQRLALSFPDSNRSMVLYTRH